MKQGNEEVIQQMRQMQQQASGCKMASHLLTVYPYCGDDTESKGLPALSAFRGQSRVDGKGLLRQKLTRGTVYLNLCF